MPIPVPNLDDRTYEQLVEEARALLPGLSAEWTDYNPSDPGMTLVELFAWLTDMMIYRVNRVPQASYDTFLKLLNGPEWERRTDLAEAIKESVLALRERYRAVTCDDYVYLATTAWPRTEEAKAFAAQPVVRAHCLARRDLTAGAGAWSQEAPGHMSLIVVPSADPAASPVPSDELLEALWDFFDQRRLLTVRHHVVGPVYVPIEIRATLHLQPDALGARAQQEAATALRRLFDPLAGGSDGQGWPFGRDVHVSEVYQALDGVAGVDYVEDVQVDTSDAGRVVRSKGQAIGITVHPHELVALADPALEWR